MRPIDADALKVVPNVRKVTEYDETGCGIDYLAIPVEVIEDAPTIDVAQVVRCKDCKELEEIQAWNGSNYYCCKVWDAVVNCNGFCDHGVKMDEEEQK
jgi:hypothetical protein